MRKSAACRCRSPSGHGRPERKEQRNRSCAAELWHRRPRRRRHVRQYRVAPRLDFTVIGPAVNMASRLETLTKQLGRTVLLSRAFADFVESDFDLERVGEYAVRGFNDRIELFAYHG
ncbi:MAG TPA: adenylate/guanylate cyclase domain-containing protein [Steroidobacteraceae bacterium]|nr:adenylate/guanylate cyclase domain-containing protein [Steroidobacteraceae bacterium]